MKDLLTFIITTITGSDNFGVSEEEASDRITLQVVADKSIVGLIIGKEGKTIKNIRKILSIKATKADKIVTINVTERS